MKQDSTFAANLKAQRRDTAYSRLINPKEPEERDLDSPPGSPRLNLREHSEDKAERENPNLPRPSKASVEIKRVFHPHSKRPPIFQSFPDYVASDISVHAPANSTPWKPFRTRLDFEVAEFCELAMLNTEMTETLITLIRRCGNNIKIFTIANHSELDKLWGLASHKCTEFVEDTIAVPYKEENRTYKTYTRPIWDWVLSLVQDPRLASCFVWDAEKAYRYNGDTYVRFYHEPWTADAFWAAQSALPKHPDAKVLGLIIYADKSKLSTFGTEKAYAVAARVANILVPIRNIHYSKVGSWTQCGDDLRRWLWPMILILASDYEEACVMALIRGLNALYPCPICFVPWNEQTAAEREQLLKDNSLRDVENVFWKINNTDPHAACSFDRLHAYGGLWTDHLFAQIKLRVTEKGRNAIAIIDKQMSSMPRWRDLNHFDAVMNITFNDGSKNEDIAKMMLFAAHNVLIDAPGVQLLQCARSFLELNIYVSLEVHTSKTIAAGERTEYGDKSWNFPKMHSHRHVFDDIKNKGATRNFGTKISESMHGPIRQTYHRLTNFKNVTPQLIKHDHRRAVGLFIREQLEVLDAPGDSECPPDQETEILSNISIGSKLKPITFSVIEDTNSGDAAFARFRVRFADSCPTSYRHMAIICPMENEFDLNRMIRYGFCLLVPFQFLKVHYEHLGNWTSSADYLRCNPSFHGHPRYDGALVKTTDGHIFVQLIYMFSCTVEKKSHPFGLVLPLDTRAIGRKDRLLRFHRLHAKPRKNAEFISAHSIIRGVLLAPDFDNYGEFLIVDIVDTDISLRLKDMYPDRY
ncbi:hypothetical protein B0H17DRAFT_1276808 [Mycena rosella]|uniref:Uncharacterized protein n=1 Tax=Mycena rosella TaxID=1033263 RepID=A0AAD7FUT1_MYCRO|nr:hypothetical protein B0H17DRAFT_1276808 [Mycena rosella]